MICPISLEHYMEILEWVKTQKRVTTYTLEKAFGLTYSDASWIYKKLRDNRVIGYGGYTYNVEPGEEDNERG